MDSAQDNLPEGLGPIDPRIAEWVKEDFAEACAELTLRRGALRAELNTANRELRALIDSDIDEASEEWRDTVRAALEAAEAFAAADGETVKLFDTTLEALSGMRADTILCFPRYWLERNLCQSDRLAQLVREGVLAAATEYVRFECSVRMGGYKFRKIKQATDDRGELQFAESSSLVGHDGVRVTFAETKHVGNFEKARRRAVADIESDTEVHSQGEEWDTMNHASAWAEFPVVVVFGPRARLWPMRGDPSKLDAFAPEQEPRDSESAESGDDEA